LSLCAFCWTSAHSAVATVHSPPSLPYAAIRDTRPYGLKRGHMAQKKPPSGMEKVKDALRRVEQRRGRPRVDLKAYIAALHEKRFGLQRNGGTELSDAALNVANDMAMSLLVRFDEQIEDFILKRRAEAPSDPRNVAQSRDAAAAVELVLGGPRSLNARARAAGSVQRYFAECGVAHEDGDAAMEATVEWLGRVADVTGVDDVGEDDAQLVLDFLDVEAPAFPSLRREPTPPADSGTESNGTEDEDDEGKEEEPQEGDAMDVDGDDA